MIRTNNIKKIFKTDEVQTLALNNVNLQINTGEFVSIMGPSGCGKTTLMNILGLLDNVSSGELYFADDKVSDFTEKQRSLFRKSNIGFVFQNFNLIDELSVFENVELPLLYQKVPTNERKKKVNSALERMELIHRKNHFPQQLSGGQQQRTAVARAIITNPKLLLADEPTGNLDSKNGDEVMKILKELNSDGTTIVMVTHSPTYAEFGSRIIHLFDGQISDDAKNGKFFI